MAKIVAVDLERNNEVSRVLLDDGRIETREQAYILATRGELEGIVPASRETEDGFTYYIRSAPDSVNFNNIRELPSIDDFLNNGGKSSNTQKRMTPEEEFQSVQNLQGVKLKGRATGTEDNNDGNFANVNGQTVRAAGQLGTQFMNLNDKQQQQGNGQNNQSHQ